jgi:hypothetical protein
MSQEITVIFFYLVVDLRAIRPEQIGVEPFDFSVASGWRVADDLAVLCAMGGEDIDEQIDALLRAGLKRSAFVVDCEDGLANTALPKDDLEGEIEVIAPWLSVRRTHAGSTVFRVGD